MWTPCRTFAVDEEDLLRQRATPAQEAFPERIGHSGRIAFNVCIVAGGRMVRKPELQSPEQLYK